MTLDLKKLAKKFPEQDIEWRVQQCGSGKAGPWALIIPYITNRAIMARLDEAVGPANWKNEFKSSPCGKGYLCGISIKIDGEWVTRWDGAEISSSGNIDDVKSTISSSMKRTGVQWGIGRYLYQFEATFADASVCENRFKMAAGYTYQRSKDKKSGQYIEFQWKPKPLESWALPISDETIKSYLLNIKSSETEDDLKMAYIIAYKLATSEGDDELLEKFTKAKDAKKILLASELDNQDEENTRKCRLWFERKVTDLIITSKNESTLKIAKNTILGELYEKSEELGVPIIEMKKALEDYAKKQQAKF